MSNHARACALAFAVMATLPLGVHATVLDGVQPGALDQPQINVIIYVDANAYPQIGLTTDPTGGLGDIGTGLGDLGDLGDIGTGLGGGTGGDVPFFNVLAYLDTGASSILVSTPTAGLLHVGTASSNGQPIIYADIGVAGADNFNVSDPVRLRLAPYIPGQDLDQFLDTNSTAPNVAPYTMLVNSGNPVRVQVGPYVPPVDTTNVSDPTDQLIEEILSEQTALDVVGMPAIRGHVMVIDPTGVKNLGLLFSLLEDVLGDQGGSITDIPLEDLLKIDTAGVKTFLYDKATAPAFNGHSNNPGIPTVQRHVALSYGSFDRFSQVSVGPGGTPDPTLPGPDLAHNPFIGKNPVALLEGKPAGDAPGITITRTLEDSTVLPSTGNWLLDTGAAASIISEAQAALLHVEYDRAHGNGPGAPGEVDISDPTAPPSGATPLLVDSDSKLPVPNQFTLVLGGIGGQEVLAGFWLDTLKLPTKEGTQTGNDDLNIYFTHVPVLVGDITVADPLDPTKTLTLDGIFGMNMLIESINFQTDAVGNLTDLGDPSPSFFEWITIDLTSDTEGELGLTFDPQTVSDVAAVPEPASLMLLSGGALALLARRRTK